MVGVVLSDLSDSSDPFQKSAKIFLVSVSARPSPTRGRGPRWGGRRSNQLCSNGLAHPISYVQRGPRWGPTAQARILNPLPPLEASNSGRFQGLWAKGVEIAGEIRRCCQVKCLAPIHLTPPLNRASHARA